MVEEDSCIRRKQVSNKAAVHLEDKRCTARHCPALCDPASNRTFDREAGSLAGRGNLRAIDPPPLEKS